MRRGNGLRFVKRVQARGKWYGYFDTGQKDAAGKRIYAKIGRMDDPAFGARYAAMLGRRTARAKVADLLTVPAFVGMFQKSEKYRALSANSKLAYDIYLATFAEALATAPADKVERRDVVLLLDKMADRPAAANLLKGAVGSLYDWGRERGHVTNEPCKDIARFTIGEHEQWPELLVQAALSCADETIKLAVHLLFFTAQRISDVCGMKWSDIRNDRIGVRQQKTGKVLDIPLHAELRTLLANTPKRGLVILARENGTAIGAVRLRRLIKTWTEKQGATVVAHGLRKNAVSTLLEVGCSLAETAAISGQTLKMVEHYAKQRNQSNLASAAILKWERTK